MLLSTKKCAEGIFGPALSSRAQWGLTVYLEVSQMARGKNDHEASLGAFLQEVQNLSVITGLSNRLASYDTLASLSNKSTAVYVPVILRSQRESQKYPTKRSRFPSEATTSQSRIVMRHKCLSGIQLRPPNLEPKIAERKGVHFGYHRPRVSVHASHEALTLHLPVAHRRSPCSRGRSVKAARCG